MKISLAETMEITEVHLCNMWPTLSLFVFVKLQKYYPQNKTQHSHYSMKRQYVWFQYRMKSYKLIFNVHESYHYLSQNLWSIILTQYYFHVLTNRYLKGQWNIYNVYNIWFQRIWYKCKKNPQKLKYLMRKKEALKNRTLNFKKNLNSTEQKYEP